MENVHKFVYYIAPYQMIISIRTYFHADLQVFGSVSKLVYLSLMLYCLTVVQRMTS
jgi:uncharacterized metal-binding protein